MKITNLAGYKFVPLTDLPELQNALLERAQELKCKGTILLSQEGINLNLAALPASIAAFIAFLKEDARFADIEFKESFSDEVPFRFMRVKIKKEIITMKRDEIHPEIARAPAISPQELKAWLDANKDITMLDTRNDYEVRFGTFKNAVNLKTSDFSEFPEASLQVAKDKPIVMFCTGGVRCEKAGLHMLNHGYNEVYQLEGGILNYFKEVGGEHYEGECFVFDERVSLNANLEKTGTKQCVVCEGPIFKDQNNSCNTCHITFS